ncbi:MAG: rod shape-determining protein MreC [Nevskiaceae bacterium]|nr:MAG: rod shape-determining protein MreC [Nevskiaceae bacterium]TBR74450.1 MAG: rod shape-determining protein MreC [Nevskiaceae bacterium]
MNTLHTDTHKRLFSRTSSLRLRFVVLLAIAGTLLYFDVAGTAQLHRARGWVAQVLRPVIWIADLPHVVDDIGGTLRSRRALLEENATLKHRQLELAARLQRLQALEAENQRIRSLLAASTTLRQRVLISEVLESSQDPYRHQILIDRGSADGVYVGQAVVDAWGVLGQIVRVHPHTAVALLITDPQSGIPVEVNRTGLHSVALGRGDGTTLSLPFLPNNADVHVGDLLVSSGLGGRFPSGYPVGRIVQLRHPAGESFMEAVAQPQAHVGRGREVLLVWNTEQPAAQLPALPVDIAPPGMAGHGGKAVRPTPARKAPVAKRAAPRSATPRP